MSGTILSVAFSRGNQSAFISDHGGNIKMIKWQAGANSGNDFDFTGEPKKVGNGCFSVCLAKDEKYLLVGSHNSVFVFETTTREVTKEFKLASSVKEINLIKDGKKALIAGYNGNLSIIDLEILKIKQIAKNITNYKRLNKMIVI